MATKDKEIAELKKIPTEDAFVPRLIEATKTQFRFKRNDADSVRIVMDKVGRADAEAIISLRLSSKLGVQFIV